LIVGAEIGPEAAEKAKKNRPSTRAVGLVQMNPPGPDGAAVSYF
jgi:hypothetical protein